MPSPLDVPDRPSTMTTRGNDPQGRRQREILGAGVQDDDRPVRGSVDLRARLFRRLKKGDTVYNPVRGKKERIGRIVQMHANNREEVDEIRAGDIARLRGPEGCDHRRNPCAIRAAVITLERMVFPEPVIRQAVEPKTKADQGRWASR